MSGFSLYKKLDRILEKPGPFSVDTAEALWADPHTSKKMLSFHLDPDIDVSSRRASFIDESADWMAGHFGLTSESRVIDFGCGPGLYVSRLADTGARVTGVDFSPTSIAYAREQAESSGQEIFLHLANYVEFEPAGEFDLITLIMCDYCALSPVQRAAMLRKFVRVLSHNGRVILDVYSLSAFEQKREEVFFEKNLLSGFWSASPYYGFLVTYKYEAERVSLDKYIIVQEHDQREVYNWFQYFSPEGLSQELLENGLVVESVLGNVAGHSFDSTGLEFAVVARKA